MLAQMHVQYVEVLSCTCMYLVVARLSILQCQSDQTAESEGSLSHS